MECSDVHEAQSSASERRRDACVDPCLDMDSNDCTSERSPSSPPSPANARRAETPPREDCTNDEELARRLQEQP